MMFASKVFLGLAALLISAPTPVVSDVGGDHFVLGRLTSLAFARLDPIVDPGSVSGHVHNIMGGSCFNANPNTVEEQEACDCSSAIVSDDKSNYWAPLLYYQDEQGKLEPLMGGARVYYFTKGKDVKPFPKGMRMISGTAMQRNLSDTRTLGIRISCSHEQQGYYLPNGTSHPNGCGSVSMGIFFPSCGLASGDLDSPDHFSHLAWPQAHPGGGAKPFDDPNNFYCPDSHPIKYPAIFMEQNYYLESNQPWHSGNPVVLSNGDTLGTTFHADFTEGWAGTVLADTIEQCGYQKGVGDQLQNCPPLKKSLAEWKTFECRLQSKIPNEDVGLYRPIDALPGCNPIWPSDGPATKPTCKSAEPEPAFIYPNAQFVNLLYRMNIPMLFTEPGNLSDYWERKKFIPELGNAYTSSVKPWGWDALNGETLKSSTKEEIEAATNATIAEAKANAASSSKAPAASSAKSSTHKSSSHAATSTIGGVALAGHGASSSHSSSVHHSTVHTSTHSSAHAPAHTSHSSQTHQSSHASSQHQSSAHSTSTAHHSGSSSHHTSVHSPAHASGHSSSHYSSAHSTSTAHHSGSSSHHTSVHSAAHASGHSSSHHSSAHSTSTAHHSGSSSHHTSVPSSVHPSGHSSSHHSSAHTTAHVSAPSNAQHQPAHGSSTHSVTPTHALNSTELHASNGTAPAKASTAKVCPKKKKRSTTEELKAHIRRRSRRSALSGGS